MLARDRMGIKPLYFARRGEDLFFGSELKAILVHPEIPRWLSAEGLDCYLALNYVPAPWTLVEGIEKLLPGQWLEWRAGKVRAERYWLLPRGTETRWTPEDAEAELDRLLKQSVREHLLSDVPLSVWLSGGLDSSSLVHYAAEASPARIKTFSISFQGRSFDEASYVREVAKHYGTDHEELDLNPEQDLAGAIADLAYYCDEPNADSGALPVWFLSRLTKASATVALSGEGADELFGGYLMQRASLLASAARRLPSAALGAMLGLAKRWPVSNDKIGFEYKLKRFLEGCRMTPARAHVYWSGTFDDQEKRGLVRGEVRGALDSVLEELAGEDLESFLWFDQKYFLPDNILTKVDHISMAHAIEVRPPFLDHRIVEFASSLPAELKIQGARQKVVLRNLMRGKLPPAILARKKIGFDIPTHDWFRGPLRPLIEDAVAFAEAEHAEFFQIRKIRALVRAHLERRANLGYHLWGLMTLFFWMKQWGIKSRTPAMPARSRWTRFSLPQPDRFTGGGGGLCRLHVFASVVDGRCGFGAGADRAQYADLRRLCDGAAGRDSLPRKIAADLLADCGRYKIFGAHDWAARIPLVLAAIALAWLATAFGTWAFGRRARVLCGTVHLDLFRPVSFYAHPDSRRDAHREYRALDVGLSAGD